ncbi:Met-10+ like-protein-domain-containing protein [Tirmania nivea]|nr:Met-10+ like-protein-domain-containing protein [Tirmania nivea]
MDTSSSNPEDDMASRLFSPPVQRTMRILDRSFFRKTVPISGAIVHTPSKMEAIRKACEGNMLDRVKFKGTILVKLEKSPGGRLEYVHVRKEMKAEMEQDPERMHEVRKLIPLHPRIRPNDHSTVPLALLAFVESKDVDLVLYKLKMEYEDWDYYEIVTSILPEDLLEEVPSGYTLTGDIAHVNLREAYLPYKQIIGQVILDKNPNIKTVINKAEEVGVSSEFRTFDMEILAGEPKTEVEAFESGCRFRFDFAKVYWNSRLETEHNRIIKTFKEGEAVADVMAGVGPFAIPAGKKKVFVWANDLNPESYKSMIGNIKRNKVGDFVMAHNEDGRDFIQRSVKDLYKLSQSKWGKIFVPPKIKYSKSNSISLDQRPPPAVYYVPPTFNHFVMNLPATAVEFLDAFVGVYTGMERLFEPYTKTKLPIIHLHIFDAREYEDAHPSICQRISKYINYKMTVEDVEFRDVRLISPKKKMYCATFRLPPEVAFAGEEGKKGMEDDSCSKIPGLEASAWVS